MGADRVDVSVFEDEELESVMQELLDCCSSAQEVRIGNLEACLEEVDALALCQEKVQVQSAVIVVLAVAMFVLLLARYIGAVRKATASYKKGKVKK